VARSAGAKQRGRQIAGPDADEVAAVQAVADALAGYGVPRAKATEVATVAICTWIATRSRLHTGNRLTETVVFDLNDAKLRGMIEASLPHIADALAKAGFPFGKSFNDLTKAEAVNLFTAGCVAYRDAAVAAGEDPEFPFEEAFNDPIPFGTDAASSQAPI